MDFDYELFYSGTLSFEFHRLSPKKPNTSPVLDSTHHVPRALSPRFVFAMEEPVPSTAGERRAHLLQLGANPSATVSALETQLRDLAGANAVLREHVTSLRLEVDAGRAPSAERRLYQKIIYDLNLRLARQQLELKSDSAASSSSSSPSTASAIPPSSSGSNAGRSVPLPGPTKTCRVAIYPKQKGGSAVLISVPGSTTLDGLSDRVEAETGLPAELHHVCVVAEGRLERVFDELPSSTRAPSTRSVTADAATEVGGALTRPFTLWGANPDGDGPRVVEGGGYRRHETAPGNFARWSELVSQRDLVELILSDSSSGLVRRTDASFQTPNIVHVSAHATLHADRIT